MALCVGCTAPEQTRGNGQCLLGATFERDTSLSRRVSEYLVQKQRYFMESALPVSALWYTSGEGRSGFRYAAGCDLALRSAHAAFERLAAEAPPDIARQLRQATWRELSQAEIENAAPWPTDD